MYDFKSLENGILDDFVEDQTLKFTARFIQNQLVFARFACKMAEY
jgi:hypothetical protein